ncbi:serine/threonine-protein kinase [Demequina sp. NBRC 110053]|uniref:serine/threonine-protein kinase n=1 Tax=Demequina sp. NBRC 110053 TaxID=1570342 RepID=UPI0009FBD69B|nr:serine/threonine-protein kinase [Demequina sp. NBRC 110053]
MAGVTREAGEDIGGYVVIETLGRGGSGAVYKVRDAGGHEAALKLVDARHDHVAAQRLEREVHALQALRHPAVPRILDAELDGDETFVVFEYIPGVSVWQHVQDHGPLVGEELATFAERTASALEAAHRAGVVHRDVTPSNIMMGPDGPVLIDFGLSHREQDPRLTRDGLVSGTAGYVAPEVIDGAVPGPIADCWSWAATVAYAMTGRAPFGSGTGAISKTLEADVDLPRVPGAEALQAALGRDIGDRPSPSEVVAAMRGATTVMARSDGGLAPTAVMTASAAHSASAAQSGMAVEGGAAVDPTLIYGDDEPSASTGTPASVPSPPLSGDPIALEDADAGTLPIARVRRHHLMVATWMLAVAGAAALAPFVAFFVLVGGAVVVRAVQRRAHALHLARQRKGQRRGDAALHTLGLPWHLLRAAGETVPAALIAAGLGGATAAGSWWLVSAEHLAPGTDAAQAWGHAIALAAGGVVAALALWWGPWMAMTREGAHRVADALAPTRGVAAAWVVVALAALGVIAVAVYLGATPWSWPLPELPA